MGSSKSGLSFNKKLAIKEDELSIPRQKKKQCTPESSEAPTEVNEFQ